MSFDRMIEKIVETQNPTVAGLDPKLAYIPSYILDGAVAKYGKTLEAAAAALLEYNKGLIDALCDIVPAVKPQAAYYEMYGWQGVRTLAETVAYARAKGMFVITDGKRNDIGTTMEAYATAHLGKTDVFGEKTEAFGADALTVNGYLGTDGIKPLLGVCEAEDKGIFVLVKTSNPSSGELQDQKMESGKTVYETMGAFCEHWGESVMGKYGYSGVGGISSKGITLKARPGNPAPRIAEAPGGMLNAVGLQNPGVDHFIEKDLPWLREQGVTIIANIAGNTPEDYCAMAEKLNDTDIDMIEMNISCPNVKQGGVQFGTSCAGVEDITKAVRAHCKKPLMVKLSPNVTDISEIALAAESAGADAVSMINTLTGMRIDINTKRPIIHNNTGGFSGPALLPIAVRMVWQTYQKVKIPIVGLGGISTWQDAVEMLLAGATALQIGTVLFTDPYAPVKITEGLTNYMDKNGVKTLSELTGAMRPW